MRRLIALLLLAIGATAIVRTNVVPWWRNWGRRVSDDGPLPGDDIVAGPTAVETRGIDIHATPDRSGRGSSRWGTAAPAGTATTPST